MEYFKYQELLSPPIHRAAYSDRTAWLMAEMSSLAYLEFDKNAEELKRLKSELTKAEFELVGAPFDVGGTQAFLVKREKDRMAVLAFRGTQIKGLALETFLDGLADLYATLYSEANGVKMHRGFLMAYQNVEQDIQSALNSLNDYALYVTGHSLGGALALMAARAIKSDKLAACYTFGSPKVGNEEFGEEIKAPIYRIVNSYDLVPFLPYSKVLWPLVWFLSNKVKNKVIKQLGDDLKLYRHYGDQRFLTDAANDTELKVQTECNEVWRSYMLIKSTWGGVKDIGIQHHSIDMYCAKLEKWALKRLHMP